jgi:acetoacetyl-CoA reductase
MMGTQSEIVEDPKTGQPVATRIAFVSGGMGGIGTAICRRLGRAGHTVVAGCLPDYDRKAEWLAQMRSEGVRVHAAEGDVGEFDSCAGMFQQIAATVGPVDILINNAGITRDSERGWGRIINISSVNAIKGQFGQTNYSAAKAGMAGFSKALAQEVVRKGVTVNTVSPGYVETEMVMAIKKEIRDQIVAQIPMGRLAKPEEIAAVVAFLASEEAGYITGANISVNGGMHMM